MGERQTYVSCGGYGGNFVLQTIDMAEVGCELLSLMVALQADL